MHKRMVVFLLGAAMVAALPLRAVEAQEAADVKAALEKIQKAAEEITSFEADLTMAMSVMNQPITTTGHIAVLKPEKMRMTMTMPPHGDTEVISDGTTTWTYMPAMNMVQKTDNAAMKNMAGMGGPGRQMNDPSKVLEQLEADSLRFVGEETVDGQPCSIFEGKVPEQARKMGQQFAPQSIKVWVAGTDGLCRKMEAVGPSGATMMAMTFSNIKVNAPLPEEQFTFTPPAGAQTIDMSRMMQSMLGNAQPGAPPQQ